MFSQCLHKLKTDLALTHKDELKKAFTFMMHQSVVTLMLICTFFLRMNKLKFIYENS